MVPVRARAALLILAIVMFLSSSFSHYLNVMVSRVKTQPDASFTIDSDINLAEQFLKEGNWDDAIRFYERARAGGKLKPADALKLAGAYYHNRRFGEALKNLNQFIDVNPGVSGAYQSRALIQDKLGHYNAAIGDMDKYLEINKTARGYIFRSVLHYHNQDFNSSILDLERAEKIDPTMDSVYTNMGFVYAAMGDYKKARKCLDKSIMMSAENNYAYVIRGWLHILEGNNEAARSDLRHSMKTNGDNSSLQCALAFISVLENNKEEFSRNINDAYLFDPENSDIYYIGAMEQIQSAENSDRNSVNYVPTFNEATECDRSAAAEFIWEASRLDPYGADLLWYKQAAKFTKNRKAQKLFEQMIKINPKSEPHKSGNAKTSSEKSGRDDINFCEIF